MKFPLTLQPSSIVKNVSASPFSISMVTSPDRRGSGLNDGLSPKYINHRTELRNRLVVDVSGRY